MADIFCTLIINAATAPLARQIAAAMGGGGMGMWTTPLSATGIEPVSHYISSGYIPEQFAFMVPFQVWEQNETGQWVMTNSTIGNADAVANAASEAGVLCNANDVQDIFDAADVTAQEPFLAISRMGLKIVNTNIEI